MIREAMRRCKSSCALSELSLSDIGHSKLLDLSTIWPTAVIFLVPSHVPCGSQKRSSESQRVSGAEALYNILKGSFFDAFDAVFPAEELSQNGGMHSTNLIAVTVCN